MVTRGLLRRRTTKCSGYAMLLVLIGVVTAFTVGMTFLAGASTTVNVAALLGDHAKACRIAESALDAVIHYVEETSNWRSLRTSGAWITDLSFGGGTVSVSGSFTSDPLAGALSIDDHSFEEATGELPTPLFGPPMSGTIGGWSVERTAALVTGPTVPRIGTVASASATDGMQVGFISFTAVATGTGTFTQALVDTVEADAAYVLRVDAGTSGLAALLSSIEIRLLAGATELATSGDASALTVLDLGGGTTQYQVRYQSDAAPPAGVISIELKASSILGLASAVTFDRVELDIEDRSPLVLTAVAHLNNASHVIQAEVVPDEGAAGEWRVAAWEEP